MNFVRFAQIFSFLLAALAIGAASFGIDTSRLYSQLFFFTIFLSAVFLLLLVFNLCEMVKDLRRQLEEAHIRSLLKEVDGQLEAAMKERDELLDGAH